jgi:hypothetical protein
MEVDELCEKASARRMFSGNKERGEEAVDCPRKGKFRRAKFTFTANNIKFSFISRLNLKNMYN